MAKGVLTHPLTWFAAVCLAWFWPEILQLRYLSPADLILGIDPWTVVRPHDFTRATNPIRSDEVLLFFPRRVAVAADYLRYGLTLWQDHTFAGTPNTFSLGLGAVLFPPMLAFLLPIPPGLANTLTIAAGPVVAGLFMYPLAARITTRPLGRLLACSAWAFTGQFVVWQSATSLVLVFGALPMLIHLGLRFLETREIRSGVLYALLYGWTFYMTYPPASILVTVFLAIVFGVWLLSRRLSGLVPVLGLAVLSALGAAVGALPLVTTIADLTPLISHYRAHAVGLPLTNLQTWVFPNLSGSPLAYDWRATGNYCEYIAYSGIVPLLLTVFGLASGRRLRRHRDPLFVGAAVIGLISLLTAYGIGPGDFLNGLPGLAAVTAARWQIGIAFAVIVLGTFGFDAVAREPAVRVPAALAALTGVLLGAGILALHRHDFQAPIDPFIVRDYEWRAVLIGAAVLVIAAVPFLAGRRRAGAEVALVALLLVDLMTFGVGFNPSLPPAQFYPVTPALEYLKQHQDGYRVLAAERDGGFFPGDVLSVYGIDTLVGYDHFRDQRFENLLGPSLSANERQFAVNSGFLILGETLDLTDPVFNELSVGYAFFPNDGPDRSAQQIPNWEVVYAGGDGRIYRNLTVLPRQFVVDGTSLTGISHRAAAPDHDLLTAQGPGLLVWSHGSDPDWVITVNGRTRATATYGGYFEAVQLDPGTNRVETAYRPRRYYASGAVSGAALLVLGGLLVFDRRRRRRSQRSAGATSTGL